MAADPQIVRQWLMLKTLASRRQGLAVRDLADELHVNEKTVRRDLQLLRGVGFALEETVGERGRKTWQLALNSSQPELGFCFDELLALYLGRRFLDPLAGTLVWQAAQNAFKKIRACVAPSALKYLEKMSDRVHLTTVGAGDYSLKGEILDQVQRGIEDSKATLIEYRSQRSTEPVTYEVFPYTLTNHRGSLYLVAHSREHDQVRLFKIDRLESAEVTEFPFHRPEDFNAAEYFRGSFGIYQGDADVAVRVRFSPDVARYVQESRWHSSQQLAKQRDGSLVGEFQLSSTEEIKHWLLSFGPKVVVLQPAELRAEISAELHAMLASYEQPAVEASASPERSPRVPVAARTAPSRGKQRKPNEKSNSSRGSRTRNR
ncbi:MAG TPA: transcriptional regulator [Pirellulales bacterium]|nr:transcriptional regulator [Pirellulales bacterium]